MHLFSANKRIRFKIRKAKTAIYLGKIYRFMDMNGIIQSLESSTLRYSSSIKFNDPLDCSFYTFDSVDNAQKTFNRIKPKLKKEIFAEIYKCLKKVLGEDRVLDELIEKVDSDIITENDLSKMITDDQAENIFKKILISDPTILYNPNNIKFCCFSKDYYSPQSALMWSHYADKHKGACLAFDVYKLAKETKERSPNTNFLMRNRFLKEINHSTIPFEVRYVRKIPKLKFVNSRKDFRWLITKSKIWSYEKEVRCILTDTKSDQNSEDVIFPFKYLTKIVFGKLSSHEYIEKVKAIVQDKYPNNEIQFEQMKIDDNSLVLIPENLEKMEERDRILKEKYDKYRI